MASFHLCVHPPVSRGKGQSIVRTAAYNGRTQLVDERTGEVWDYRHLGETLASGIYAPKDAPDWARDLQRLVTEIERVEKRSDAQLAFNIDIALPHELSLEQNRRLAQDLVREEWQRKGYAVIADIHAPDPKGDKRNIHLHVWGTLRKIDADGFARTKAEQQENYRNRSEYTEYLREKWEHLANRHLERAGVDARIDRRSLQDQGIDREPEQHRGPVVTVMEREGNVTRVGDEIRRRQHHYAELKALAAEERQIDARIIDLQAARAEREARAAARGQVDDIRAETASRDFSRAASGATETAREAVQTHEVPAAPSAPAEANTRSTEAQRAAEEVFSREARPARETPRVIHLGPPAAELDHVAEQTVEKGAHVVGSGFDVAADMVEKSFDFLGDLFAPAPPPTKEQVQQRQEDAEFRFGLAAWAREQAAKAERQAEARRSQDAAEREAEDERGRQRERERDRGYEREM